MRALIHNASQPVLTAYLQQTGLIFEGECKPFSPKNWTIWKLSLFMTFLCFLSEIFCIKPFIVACSCAVSNSGSVHLYEQREQGTKMAVIQNISLGIHRMWMNEWSHKNVKDVVSCHETFQCSKCVQAFHFFSLLSQHYGMNKCLLWNVQILKKLKDYQNSLTKVQALTCVKIVLGVEWFQKEIRVFVLYECN